MSNPNSKEYVRVVQSGVFNLKSEIFVSLIHRGEVDGAAQYSQEEVFPNDLFTGQECPDFLFKCQEDDFGGRTSI